MSFRGTYIWGCDRCKSEKVINSKETMGPAEATSVGWKSVQVSDGRAAILLCPGCLKALEAFLSGIDHV